MKKIVMAVCVGTALLLPSLGFADKAGALTAMKNARGKLVTLLGTSDAAAQKTLIDEIHTASAEADKLLAAEQADAKVKEATAVWEEFKTTRETELIPAIQKGDLAKAKELAGGVQKERFKKISELMK